MDQQYRILTVCTGNICRSPAAAAWLTALSDGSVAVASAGTAAVVGAPVHPPMAALMRRAGLSRAGFTARQATAGLVGQADLVLTMTAQHRAWVVGREPAAVRRTFTLLEFAGFAHLVGGGRRVPTADWLRHVVASVPTLRTQLGGTGPADAHDVPDPYGLGNDVYKLAFTLIEGAVRDILKHS